MVRITNFLTKPQIILFGIFFICFLSNFCYADNSNIGFIDLNKALILHPKMIFFDYSRLGFYKNKIYKNTDTNVLNQENTINSNNNIEIIKSKIRDLKIKLSNIPTETNNQYFKDEIINIQNKIERLKIELSDIEFNIANSEITTISETKVILDEISKEVIETINEIAEEHQLSVVLNNSEISQKSFPLSYDDRSAFKSGIIIGLGSPYYLFLSEAINSAKTGDIPSSVNLSNWLEYARDHLRYMNKLNMQYIGITEKEVKEFAKNLEAKEDTNEPVVSDYRKNPLTYDSLTTIKSLDDHIRSIMRGEK